jgi:HAD superfamily hydrolase (TIGR01509 family)
LSEIVAVTFDLWQTLLYDNRERGLARAELRLEGAQQALARSGERYDLEHIREAYWACAQRCREIREGLLDIAFREQVEIFIENINPGLVSRLEENTIEEVARAYSDSFFVHPPTVHPDSAAVLRNVKAMGLRIGLISNTGMTPGKAFRRFLEQHEILHYFDVMTYSDEVKISKPAPQIFHLTLESLRVAPGQVVHVGDSVANDVAGANRCGLKTVWIAGFSEEPDPADPDAQPDAIVSDLAQVVPAVSKLTGRDLPKRCP